MNLPGRMALQSIFQRFASSAVAWSFVATGLRLGGAILVLPIVLRYLPSEQLGLWYVFQSVGLVVLLMDAGFGLTVVRSMGYLWKGVTRLLPTGLAANEAEAGTGRPNYPLMADLVVTMNWYYRAIALLILIGLLGPGSVWMWQKTAALQDAAALRGAWVFFCIGTALNVATAIWVGLLIGINGVRLSEQTFALGTVLNLALIAFGLRAGWGLWAMVAGQFVQAMTYRLGGRFGFLVIAGPDYRAQRGRLRSDLLKTLWPMSWRSAAMGLGSYLILFSNTLVCSALLGLAETGSYGLTFQLVTAVVGVSSIWVNVKLPVMNQLRASGNLSALATLFIQRLRLSLATYLAGAAALLVAGPWFVRLIGSKTELLPFPQTATLLLVMFFNLHQSLHTSLVLSRNQNPFVAPMLLTGVGIALTSVVLVPHFGTWGLIASLGLVQLAFTNWWMILQGVGSVHLRLPQFLRRLFFGVATA